MIRVIGLLVLDGLVVVLAPNWEVVVLAPNCVVVEKEVAWLNLELDLVGNVPGAEDEVNRGIRLTVDKAGEEVVVATSSSSSMGWAVVVGTGLLALLADPLEGILCLLLLESRVLGLDVNLGASADTTCCLDLTLSTLSLLGENLSGKTVVLSATSSGEVVVVESDVVVEVVISRVDAVVVGSTVLVVAVVVVSLVVVLSGVVEVVVVTVVVVVCVVVALLLNPLKMLLVGLLLLLSPAKGLLLAVTGEDGAGA